MTDRGHTAAEAIRAAIDAIDTVLARLITADQLHALRAGLAAFRQIREQAAD